MEPRKIKIVKGPNKNQLFEACKNIRKGQTEVFTIEVNDGVHLLPCYISVIDSSEVESDNLKLNIVVKQVSLVRHSLQSLSNQSSLEVTLQALYKPETMVGEINFPVD